MVERNTAIKIAYWYYTDGMTQEEIAKKLGWSRQRVNKAVNSLIDDGVVSIVINGLDNDNIRLEHKIEHEFSLKQVIIADSGQSEASMLSELGKRAAQFLDGYIQNGKTIGVSWGLTLGETIRWMQPVSKRNCSVVQLVGGVNTAVESAKPDEVTRQLAHKLNCDYSILYAPAIMDSEAAREILAQQDMSKKSFERMGSCDIALVGIGQLDESATIVSLGFLLRSDLYDMLGQGYIGDVCFNHYKADGDTGSFILANRVMGVDIETLKKIPVVIGIAGGEIKAQSTFGALNTGCIDILITDTTLASKLEEYIDKTR